MLASFAPAPLLAPLNVRNRFWDGIFYDVGSLAQEDMRTLFPDIPDNLNILSPITYREGEIIVVPPREAGRRIRHYKSTLWFMNREGQDIRALVVAGVGSSVLGTAALARDVADTYNCDVAGIITGYGGSDLLTEALGGWFVLGALDRSGFRFDRIMEALTTSLPDVGANGGGAWTGLAALSRLYESMTNTPDIATLVEVLMANPPRLEWLVGHSKGSLIISLVLERFVEELEGDPHPLFDRLNVRTLGAVVSLPEQFKNARQFMGELDNFGELNSHRGVPFEEVRGAWHHLNPQLPPDVWHKLQRRWQLPPYNHLDVSEVLRSERGDFPEKPMRGNLATAPS